MNAPLLLRIPEVGEQLGCSENHVYRLIAAGKLRSVEIRVGRRSKTRVRADDLEAFIDANTTSAVAIARNRAGVA